MACTPSSSLKSMTVFSEDRHREIVSMTVFSKHRYRQIASMTVFFTSSHTVIDDAEIRPFARANRTRHTTVSHYQGPAPQAVFPSAAVENLERQSAALPRTFWRLETADSAVLSEPRPRWIKPCDAQLVPRRFLWRPLFASY